ncbi:TPA: hypothetical protein ACF35N_004494 [Vibrio parahaemolyticus]
MKKIILAIVLSLTPTITNASSDSGFWADKQQKYNTCVSSAINDNQDTLSVSVNELITRCAEPESGADLAVESISLIAPETTTRLIYPDDKKERSLASFIFSNVIGHSSRMIYSEWGIDPFAVYTSGNRLSSDLALKQYDSSNRVKSLSAYSITIEEGLSFVVTKLCQFVAALYLLILLRRFFVSLLDSGSAKDVLKTTLKESIPALLCLYLIIPHQSSLLPPVGELLIAAYLAGALVASASMQLLAQVLVGIYSPKLFMSTSDVSDYAKTTFSDEYTKFIDEASSRIVYLDSLFSNYMTTKHGSYKGAVWGNSLDDKAISKCVLKPRSYWHMNYALDSDCKIFATAIGDAASDNPKVYVSTASASDKIDRYMQIKSLLSRDSDSQIYNRQFVEKLMDEVYAVADKKKGALCSVIPKLGAVSAHKGEYFCWKFDNQRGQFTDIPLAPDFYSHLNDMSTPWGQEQAQSAADTFKNARSDSHERELLSKRIIDVAKLKRSDLIEVLQSVDVSALTLRSALSSIWNGIYVSSSISKGIIDLEEQSISTYAKFFNSVLDVIPEVKYASIEELRENADDVKYKDSNELIKYYFWLSSKAETEETSLVLGSLSYITKAIVGISPEQCVKGEKGCIDNNAHPSTQISLAISRGLSLFLGLHLVSTAIGFFVDDNSLLQTLEAIANASLVVVLLLIAFGVMPFFLYYLYAMLKAFVRLIVYLIAAPVVIFQWFFKKNFDVDFDDSNIFYPRELSGMMLRLFAEQIAINLSMILCMTLITFNISILAVMSSVAIKAIIGASPDSILWSAKVIITLSMSVLVLISSYLYAAYQTAKLQPYIYDKLTDFIYTGFRLNTDKDDEAEVILGIFTPIFGIIRRN